MKKRTIKAGKFQRHYATNGILMYRERKNLIEVPEGTMVEILKARRQTHLCSVKCVEQEGRLVLGSGKKAVDVCIAIPTDSLPKLKIETVEVVDVAAEKSGNKGSKKSSKKGGKKVKPAPAVAAEVPAAGVGPADLNVEQPQAEQPAPAIEAQPAAEQAPVEQAPQAEAAV